MDGFVREARVGTEKRATEFVIQKCLKRLWPAVPAGGRRGGFRQVGPSAGGSEIMI